MRSHDQRAALAILITGTPAGLFRFSSTELHADPEDMRVHSTQPLLATDQQHMNISNRIQAAGSPSY
jgi:hypothetical protein